MKKNREKIFLIALFLAGLFTVFSYGAHLDQRTEQGILSGRFGFRECREASDCSRNRPRVILRINLGKYLPIVEK